MPDMLACRDLCLLSGRAASFPKILKMDWTHRTVLVTGAGGFIGSHLTERLVALGAKTRAFVHYNSRSSWGWLDYSPNRKDVEVIAGDIRDADTVRQAMTGAQIVFHLASLIAIPYSYRAPLSYVRTNVEGAVNVCQAALDAGVECMVHTSTSETYGTARYVPIDELHPVTGQSPYSASKIGGDKIVESFHLSFGLPVSTIRPFNTYGPRQSSRAVIPTIITQALTQDVVRLGSLTPTRDLTFVADTVEGFIRMADAPQARGQVVNLGSGREIAVGDLARLILDLVERDLPITCDSQRVRPEGSEVARLCADTRQARELLGWSPGYCLRDGLMETIRWVKDNLEQYRLGVYAI